MAAVLDDAPADARLIDPNLFSEDRRRLRASICQACDNLAFPAQHSCARCTGTAVEPALLERRGRLWGYTVQRFAPKSPYLAADRPDGAPFGVGYVELTDVEHRSTVLVESRLTVTDVDRLEVGLHMELVFEPLPAADGDHVWSFAFAPVGTREEVPA